MVCSLNIELEKILLRRRNKVIIDSKETINDVFKKGIETHISLTSELKNVCVVEKCEGVSVTVKIGDKVIEFEDGKLMNDQNKKHTPIHESLLMNIVREETEKIKDRMIYALTFNKELQGFGYCMDEMLFNVVATFPASEVKQLSDKLIPILKEMVGSNVIYRPLYPNFPTQVIEMKTKDLYLNSIRHYWSNGNYYPPTEFRENISTSFIGLTFKNITIGKEEDLHKIMFNLMNSAEAISSQDIHDLITYFKCYKNFMDTVPESIPNKENLAVITNLILTHCKEPPMDRISRRFATVTDVLRLAAIMSNQSATLCRVRFKSFSQKERRFIMELLNNCTNRSDDFHKHKNMWVRLCERIHPMKYRKVYPDLVEDLVGPYKFIRERKNLQRQLKPIDTILNIGKSNDQESKDSMELTKDETTSMKEAIDQLKKFKFSNKDITEKAETILETKSFHSIQNTLEKTLLDIKSKNDIRIVELNKKVEEYKKTHQRYNSKVEYLLSQKDYFKALIMLSSRPGIFARRLDELLSNVEDKDMVLRFFEEIAPKISIKVLLSVKGYFQKRHEKLKVRVFSIVKERTSKLYMKKHVKGVLDLKLCETICHICEKGLMVHFEEKQKMNNVFISEDLKKHVIPLDLRSSNSVLETYAKGSRFNINYNELTEEERIMLIHELQEEIANNEKEIEDNNAIIGKEVKYMDVMDLIIDGPNKKVNIIMTTMKEYEDYVETLTLENQKLEKRNKILKNSLMSYQDDMHKKKRNKIRLFIWWTNNRNQRVDIDLSVMIYDEDLCSKGHVSYTRLRDSNLQIYHSGDITNGGPVKGSGAAEFIDFDPAEVVNHGGRYVAASIISYCGIKFKDLKNCKFGWMERDSLNSNELFEPSTVRQRLDVNSDNTSTVPVVFDCKTREIIWIDSNLTSNNSEVRIERSHKPMNAILYYYLNPLKDNMYNLLNLHVQARNGHLVESEKELEDGDIAFVSSLPYKPIKGVKYVRPTDLDIILSEYMT